MRDPSFLSEPYEDWAGEFLASDSAAEFRPDLREAGGPALAALLSAASRRAGGLEGMGAEHLLRALRLDLNRVGVPPQLPALAEAFLSYLEATGRLSGGGALGEAVRAGGAAVEDCPPAPEAGRNDPCPCGSGRKYKKCCGG